MLINDKERKICEKYGKRDSQGKVHCFECPLGKSQGTYDFRCKANSHYNRKTNEWEYDEDVKAVKDRFCSKVEQSIRSKRR